MAITQRTVEEASKYIQDSIEDWKKTGQDNKIISLSNWAEKWRSNTGGPVAKMKDVKKSINDLKRIIKRKLKVNPDSNNTALQKELENHEKYYASLVANYGEPKTKQAKKVTTNEQ
jgi:gas vesicle protein